MYEHLLLGERSRSSTGCEPDGIVQGAEAARASDESHGGMRVGIA
jgi:hypothetical protein